MRCNSSIRIIAATGRVVISWCERDWSALVQIISAPPRIRVRAKVGVKVRVVVGVMIKVRVGV